MAESTTKKQSVFEVLNAVNCKEHTESKGGLSYLSWAWAWAEVKKRYPGAFYTIYENDQHFPYFTDGRTAWVKTGVTIDGLEHIEYLPIMNQASKASLPLAALTSWDVNKAIQRSLTKACARHGLGLYIYAGEDLPEGEPAPAPKPEKKPTKVATTTTDAPIPEGTEYKPLPANVYDSLVKGEAYGELTKTGLSCKRWFIQHSHAGAAEIAAFDKAVAEYRTKNNINA